MSLTDRVTCPFDSVHVVERRRLQAHIIKCKRNLPPNNNFIQCPFWHLHYVVKSEYDDHLDTCEHRLEKEANRKTWEAEAPKFAQPKLLVDEEVPQFNYDENWDDMVGPTFNPDKLISEAKYMTVPQGLSKSKRKDFQERERERLREREDKKTKFVDIKEEKITPAEEPPQPPRKPADPVLVKYGRIAAKFPAQTTSDAPQVGRASSSASSPLTFQTPVKSGGRGRGSLAGWSAASSSSSFCFSPGDFPSLH